MQKFWEDPFLEKKLKHTTRVDYGSDWMTDRQTDRCQFIGPNSVGPTISEICQILYLILQIFIDENSREVWKSIVHIRFYNNG